MQLTHTIHQNPPIIAPHIVLKKVDTSVRVRRPARRPRNYFRSIGNSRELKVDPDPSEVFVSTVPPVKRGTGTSTRIPTLGGGAPHASRFGDPAQVKIRDVEDGVTASGPVRELGFWPRFAGLLVDNCQKVWVCKPTGNKLQKRSHEGAQRTLKSRRCDASHRGVAIEMAQYLRVL
jgi:hypothetical protein